MKWIVTYNVGTERNVPVARFQFLEDACLFMKNFCEKPVLKVREKVVFDGSKQEMLDLDSMMREVHKNERRDI